MFCSCSAHLLGDVHEEVVEHLQQHRVHRGAGRELHGARPRAVQHDVVQRRERRPRQPGSTTVVAFCSAMIAGPAIASPGRRSSRTHQRGVVPLRRRNTCAPFRGAAPRARGCISLARLRRRVAGDHRLDRHRLDHQRLARHQEGVALAVGGLETRDDGRRDRRRARPGPCRCPRSARARAGGMRTRAGADLLAFQLGLRRGAQRIELLGHGGSDCLRQRQLDRLLAHRALVGQAHAVGRQHAGQRMHEHARHAQRIGHQAGVLAAGAAEALQACSA